MNSACNVHNPAVFSRCIFISRWFGKAITSSARPVIANPADRPTARGGLDGWTAVQSDGAQRKAGSVGAQGDKLAKRFRAIDWAQTRGRALAKQVLMASVRAYHDTQTGGRR